MSQPRNRRAAAVAVTLGAEACLLVLVILLAGAWLGFWIGLHCV